MGKEWYWGSWSLKKEREPRGCMRGMLHFFDFYHILFRGRTPASASCPTPELQPPAQQQKHYYSSECKGVEAPRNSLDLDESVEAIREEYYGVPIGIQIAMPKKKKQPKLITEEERRNPQAVTPRTRSIVARLMGLEAFQDEAALSNTVAGGHEPTSAASLTSASKRNETSKNADKNKKKIHFGRDSRNEQPLPRRPLQKLSTNFTVSLSLPDTPRPSSEKIRDSCPRYSLQDNKENDSRAVIQKQDKLRESCRDRSFPDSPALRLSKPPKDYYALLHEENDSPPKSQYFAREIVKHMKSNISKRQASNIGVSGGNKTSEKKALIMNPDNMIKTKLPTATKPLPKKRVSRAKVEANVVKMEPGECKKARYDRFMEKIKMMSPPQRLAAEQRLVSLTKNFSSDITPKMEATPQAALRLIPPLKEKDPEFKYVKAIFACSCAVGTKALKWFSRSLPIDPSIFHILELRFPFEPGEAEAAARLGPLRHRWNRKLLFHLVEEVLGDLLLSVPNPCGSDREVLLSRLWSQIRGLPSTECREVGDIDALVARDLTDSKVRRLMRHASVVAESKNVAAEIERDVLDSLLGDAAASLLENKCGLTSRLCQIPSS